MNVASILAGKSTEIITARTNATLLEIAETLIGHMRRNKVFILNNLRRNFIAKIWSGIPLPICFDARMSK